MEFMLLGSSSSSSSSSSSLPPPVTVEKDLLTSLVASNFENSGVNVNLTLSPPTLPVQKCCMCGATSTPLWRNGPNGPKTACNACGIKYRRKLEKLNTTLELATPSQSSGKK